MTTSFSIVVNTCDRRASLETLLRSLESQTHRRFEVVVVVGPSRDDTVRMVRRDFGDRVVLARCRRFNLSVSRNVGLRHAAGDVVAFIDDDAVPCPTWLEQLAAVYDAEPEVAGVGGRTHDVREGHGELQFRFGLFSAFAEQEDVLPRPASTCEEFEAPPWACFPRFHGTNMSYRWEALAEIGGFDQHYEYLFDDADIAVRLGREGKLLRQLDQATVYHSPGTGRNRGERASELNFYCWLRSTIYCVLKNGRPLLGLRRSLDQALRHADRFGELVATRTADEELDAREQRRLRRQIFRARLAGLAHGLLVPRRIPRRPRRRRTELLPFPRPDAVAPVVPQLPGADAPAAPAVQRSPPLRICLLSYDYPPRSHHGVARSTATLARGLVELGQEVHVVCGGETDGVSYYGGAYVHRRRPRPAPELDGLASSGLQHLPHWLAHSRSAATAVGELAGNHRIQLVDSPLWQLDGLVTLERRALPVVVRVVTAMKQIAAMDAAAAPDDEEVLIGKLEALFVERCDGIVSNSRATDRTLEQVYGIDPRQRPDQHALIHYGMEPTPRPWIEPLPAEKREEPTILFVGRLEQRKGILDLFAALPRVLARFPRARVWVVGSDNSHWDGFRRATGMDYATWFRHRYPELAGNVLFLGFVGDEFLRGIYHNCDLFVAPSLYESFGLIYLEAMDVARPVVGCDVGGAPDIVVDGETGLLVPPRNPEELGGAMLRILEDPERKRAMGLAGRERLEARFTHRRMARRFLEFYHRILEGAVDAPEEIPHA